VRLVGANSSIVHKELPVDDPKQRQPDISKAKRILGWEPRFDLDTGLARTLTYFRERLDAPLRGPRG
jgi:nucleoside-diphosphate-sugar epimerase